MAFGPRFNHYGSVICGLNICALADLLQSTIYPAHFTTPLDKGVQITKGLLSVSQRMNRMSGVRVGIANRLNINFRHAGGLRINVLSGGNDSPVTYPAA